jgi:hypothetical protein
MKRMVEYQLENGDKLLVEVELDEAEQEGIVPAAKPGEMAAKATQTLEDAVRQIKPGADAIVAQLRSMSTRPDEMEVSFGIKLSAKAGAFLAAAGVESNFQVILRWNRT